MHDEAAAIAPRRPWPGIARLPRPSRLVSAAVLLIVTLCAIAAPWIAPHDPLAADVLANLQPPRLAAPSGEDLHLLGTDVLGRDVLSGLIWGGRVSLIVGLCSVLGAGVIGTTLGLIAGHLRGWVDEVIMRLVDVQLSFPFILLAVLIMYVLGPGLANVVMVLVVATWPLYARVARAETLRLSASDFVLAAHSMGANRARIIFRHILPNALTPLVVVAAFAVPQMIIFEAALSFLGLGMPPDQISWGSMLAAGRSVLENAWWIATLPGLAIMITILSINILGEALRQWIAPGTGTE
jgi:peptide/nickel transport system permease protein